MVEPAAPITVQLNAFAPQSLWSLDESFPARLARGFPRVRVVQSRDRDSFLGWLPEATVLFTWSLPRHHFPRARRLRWVHSPEAGVDALLSPEMLASDVVLTSSKGLAADAIADHAMGLIYCHSRRLAECRDLQHQRCWTPERFWEGEHIPFALAGRTILVIGLGGIGAAIARRAHAAGMTVVGVRKRPGLATPDGVREVHDAPALDALLPGADIVTLALPSTPETNGILDARRLRSLKPGALLVNVGRGALVDEAGLIEVLESGQLGGAALDVVAEEPLAKDSPLWDHPRVILSPHLAGTDPRHMARTAALFEDNLRRFLAGEPLVNQVDKRLGY